MVNFDVFEGEKTPIRSCDENLFAERVRYREKITSKLLEERNRAKRGSAEAAERRKTRKGRGIPWDKFEGLSPDYWSPNFEERAQKDELLSRHAKDGERIAFVKALGDAFAKRYEFFRRAVERDAKGSSSYSVFKAEHKWAEQAGTLCFQRGVRTETLFKYWLANAKNFTSMTVPSLAFLASPANIDSVACSEVPSTEPEKPAFGNSFSKTDGLDPRIRKTLEAHAYETREMNDRFLVYIQKNAQAVADKKPIFLAKNKSRDMIHCLAKELYGWDPEE